MPPFIDLAGRRYSRLLVIERAPNKGRHTMWVCLCDCGNFATCSYSALNSGDTKSCKCLKLEVAVTQGLAHGHASGRTKSRTYNAWANAKARCFNPSCRRFDHYGGRGITMCPAWLNSFENFLADMGECPEGKTLDRWPNVNGNYEPDNCRWATYPQQSRNRTNSIMVEHDGEKINLIDFAAIVGIKYNTLYSRMRRLG